MSDEEVQFPDMRSRREAYEVECKHHWLAFEILDDAVTQGADAGRYEAREYRSAAAVAKAFAENRQFDMAFRNEEFCDGDTLLVGVLKPGARKMSELEVFRVRVEVRPSFQVDSRGTVKEYREAAAADA